jgi:hypothetical protein
MHRLGAAVRLHAYLVSERLARRHVEDWPVGTPTPGVRFVALMVRKAELSHEEFDAYWRDVHSPIALAHFIQVRPYSQNTVVERLTGASAPLDGIAAEHFDSPSYSRDRMLRHPVEYLRGIRSATRFLELGRTDGEVMTETVLESENPPSLRAPRSGEA